MLLYILALIAGFIAFLFCLFVLSKDDTIFIRKNVSLDSLFNLAFLTFGVGVFSSRFFFVMFNFDAIFLNPLVFLLFTYYPGLSFSGGLAGGLLFLLLMSRKRKLPVGHIFDYFGISFLLAMPFGLVSTMFLNGFHLFKHLFLPCIFFTIFILGVWLVLPRTFAKEIKSGTLGISSILATSFTTLITSISASFGREKFSFIPSDSLSLITFLLALLFFFKQEYIMSKVGK